MSLTWQQIVGLFILAIPIACIARTVVYEEVFREPREYCQRKSQACRTLLARKFFYLFTCEYCFSHWVTLVVLIFTGYHLMYAGFRGYLIAFFSLVFVANMYLNLYSRLRVDITSEKKAIEAKEKEIEKLECEIQSNAAGERMGGDGHEGPSSREP
jgi:cell division protein FtsL